MRAEEMMGLRVVDVASGTNIGSVTGILIDGDSKKVVALEVGGGFLSSLDYLPFLSIKCIENDVLTIASPRVIVDRDEFKACRLVGDINGRTVFTEDGKNLGTVHGYDVDIESGEITFVTVAVDTAVMGGLWRTEGERFEIPRSLIVTLGDSIVVAASVPNQA